MLVIIRHLIYTVKIFDVQRATYVFAGTGLLCHVDVLVQSNGRMVQAMDPFSLNVFTPAQGWYID